MLTIDTTEKRGPLVSVLVPTFNRRRYLREALESVVGQTYRQFEAFVVNDGGEPVADLVAAFNDPRLVLIERRENRGKAASLNEALGRAQGKYVAYLDDDDRYYPEHLARLVETLEGRDDCHAAYTDLYKVHCRVLPDGTRQVLGKVVNISRDFDRFLLCHINHVLHVALMHRRDLFEKTGPYNEGLRVMIDWDMTRRLSFFTDLLHIPQVTGEFFGPVGECDRISYRMRKNKLDYARQVLMIRATRPAKPWPKMPDLSIVFAPDVLDAAAAGMIRQIGAWTFMPCQLYLVLPPAEIARADPTLPNQVIVPVTPGATPAARLDAALRRVEGDYVAVVSPGARVETLWVEDPLYAAAHDATGKVAFEIAGSAGGDWPAVVLRTDGLRRARARDSGPSLRLSLEAAGIAVRPPSEAERAFPFDRLLQNAEEMESDGDWAQAAWLYKQMGERFNNSRWMHERTVRALLKAGGRDGEALAVCREINLTTPTVSTLLLEARLLKRANQPGPAVALLEEADAILEGRGEPWN